MDFKTPYLLLLPLFFLIIWSFYFWGFFYKSYIVVPTLKKSRKSLRVFVYSLGLLALIFFSIAIMGPRKKMAGSPEKREANDIIFVLDVSRSMLAEDFKPNRLEVAKKKILQFVKLMPEDRIGIVAFSEKAFTLLPLTFDLDLIEKVIAKIDTRYLGSGTNIGDALGLAIARGLETKTARKTIILITDGVNNIGTLSPMEAAEKAAAEKIKVYTIGIGSDKDAKIPVNGGLFGKRYQLIPGGSIDFKTLELIAKVTKAKSFKAKSTRSLEIILKKIQQLEKKKIEYNNNTYYQDIDYKFFFTGLIFYLLYLFFQRWLLKEMDI